MVEYYQPIILIDIVGTSTYRFSTDFYVDGSGNAYKPGLLNFPDIEGQLGDIWYGVEESSRVDLRFDNTDNGIDDTWTEILAAQELRGIQVLIQRIDMAETSPSAVFQMRGKIVDWQKSKTEFSISVEMRDDEVLETLLPLGVVTADLFDATAIDVGAPINICLGNCKDVPLRNIQNDVANNQFDYLIGYGTIEGLWEDAANGYGVKRNGVLVNTAEYTAYDGSQASPYNGYAFIRFTKEQKSLSKQYYAVTADVKGIERSGSTAERDFASNVKQLLSNATWGLGDSVDATAFSDATTALSAIGDMYCDGAITEQRKARDIINDLLFASRSTIKRGSDGEWEITVDGTGASALTLGDNDGFYNNCTVLRTWCTPSNESIADLLLHYDMRRYTDREQPYMEIRETVRSTFGVDRVYELPFVSSSATALKVAGYIKGRETYSNEWVELSMDTEGKTLAAGQVFTLTCSALGISAQTYKAHRVVRDNKTKFSVTAWKYSGSIYSTVPAAAAPTAPTLPSNPTTGPQAFVPTWEAKTSAFTAESNHYYKIDTSGGAFTGDLPASPLTNDLVTFENEDGTWGDDNFTIDGNGKSISWKGVNYDDMDCDINGISVVLKYDGTVWRVM